MDTINQHILLYYNLYGGDGDGDGDGDDKICRFLGNKSTYLAKLVEEEGSTQPQLVGDLLPACASALVRISRKDHLGRLVVQADLS